MVTLTSLGGKSQLNTMQSQEPAACQYIPAYLAIDRRKGWSLKQGVLHNVAYFPLINAIFD